jgi:hypothetical protein
MDRDVQEEHPIRGKNGHNKHVKLNPDDSQVNDYKIVKTAIEF